MGEGFGEDERIDELVRLGLWLGLESGIGGSYGYS